MENPWPTDVVGILLSTVATNKRAARAKQPASSPEHGPTAATREADLDFVAFDDAAAWASWLDQNHARSTGVLVRIWKKDSGVASVRYPEVLDVALAYGWIDGVRRSLDAASFLQRFTPRGPRSIWSQINRDKAAALIASGLMKPAGLAEVERARADGRWDAAYAGQRAAEVPADLAEALVAEPRAAAFFATLSAQNRYSILFRLQQAKRAETRTRRLAEFVAMLARGETLHR